MMKENTNKGFWNTVAKIYTPFMAKNNAAYDSICKILEPYIDARTSVLELACGTGQISFRMAAKSRAWEATDYSEKMIDEAKKCAGNQCPQLVFSVQDATDLTYEAEKFDVAVIANALHIMPRPDAAIKEIHRVLKKDGLLFAPTFVYEKVYSKQSIFLMEKLGFKTYHKWTKREFEHYIADRGFEITQSVLLKGKPLYECVLIGKKQA